MYTLYCNTKSQKKKFPCLFQDIFLGFPWLEDRKWRLCKETRVFVWIKFATTKKRNANWLDARRFNRTMKGEKAGNKPERVSSVSPAGASLWIGYSESLFRLERSRCCYSVARVKRSDKRQTKNIVSQTLSGSHTHIRQTQMLFPLGDQPVSNLARDKNSGQASNSQSLIWISRLYVQDFWILSRSTESKSLIEHGLHTHTHTHTLLLLISSTNNDPKRPTLSNIDQAVFTTSFIALRYWFEGVVMAPAPASPYAQHCPRFPW